MPDYARLARLSLGGILGFSFVRLGVTERARRGVLASRCVSCIYFHDPSPPLVERCVRWLRDGGFTFISEDQVIAISKGQADAAPGAVWISFDDGWRGNFGLLPVIERYRVPVTIFLATEAVELLGLFWWTCVYDHRSELPDPYRRSVLRIWDLPERERREIVEPVLRRHQGEYARQALTIDEVQTLARSPLVSFGSHSVGHPCLPRCDLSQLEDELRVSKKAIEGWTGRPVRVFAYPRSEFDGREKEALLRNGYDLAVTVEERAYCCTEDDAYHVPRLAVGNDSVFSANVCKMVGVWRPYVDWARRIEGAVPGHRRSRALL
jgi:peptidoglycan/xylan/chitin deacetylase (PgdA/CDA1 family)